VAKKHGLSTVNASLPEKQKAMDTPWLFVLFEKTE
jgi:hypothetical protein